MVLQVHPLTFRVLAKHCNGGPLSIDASSILLPILRSNITRPKKIKLSAQIEIIAPHAILTQIRHDSGYNLYRLHYHQLLEWITFNASNGLSAHSSMMEFYKAIDLDVTELDPDSVYRQWSRHKFRKKAASHATFTKKDVLQKVHRVQEKYQTALRIVSDHIARQPASFYTRNGQPDQDMIKKVLIYTLYHECNWRQRQIAELLAIDKSVVSRHLDSVIPLISELLT